MIRNIMHHLGTIMLMALVLPFILAFAGCVSETPQQLGATAVYAAGLATANAAMKNGPSIQSQLQDVAAKLPMLNSGKLSPSDLGALSAELDNINAQLPALKGLVPADSQKLDDAKAFIAGVLLSNASLNGGRAPTVDQVVATTLLTDFANGLTDGIAYYQGASSVPKT